jgi:hypothetical protein
MLLFLAKMYTNAVLSPALAAAKIRFSPSRVLSCGPHFFWAAKTSALLAIPAKISSSTFEDLIPGSFGAVADLSFA